MKYTREPMIERYNAAGKEMNVIAFWKPAPKLEKMTNKQSE